MVALVGGYLESQKSALKNLHTSADLEKEAMFWNPLQEISECFWLLRFCFALEDESVPFSKLPSFAYLGHSSFVLLA